MITNSRIRELMNYVYNEFLVDNVSVDGRAFDDICDCLSELLDLRFKLERMHLDVIEKTADNRKK